MTQALLSRDVLNKICDTYYKYLKNWDEKLILTHKSSVPHIYYEWELIAVWNECVIVLVNFYDDYENDVCKDVTKKISYVRKYNYW